MWLFPRTCWLRTSTPRRAGRHWGPRGAAGILPHAVARDGQAGVLLAQAEIVRSLGASVRQAYDLAGTAG